METPAPTFPDRAPDNPKTVFDEICEIHHLALAAEAVCDVHELNRAGLPIWGLVAMMAERLNSLAQRVSE